MDPVTFAVALAVHVAGRASGAPSPPALTMQNGTAAIQTHLAVGLRL